jgi:hypothetical protein
MITQAASGNGTACPELVVSENCNEQTCVVAGLPCGEFRDCFSCVDGGKTAPRVCQFCVQNTASASGARLGVCQSKFNVDGNATSGQTACVEGFDLRVTTPQNCPATGNSGGTSAPASNTAQDSTGTGIGTSAVDEMVKSVVDVVKDFAMLGEDGAETATITLANGVKFQASVEVDGDAGASGAGVKLALVNGKLGILSPAIDADKAAPSYGRLRDGLTMVFSFDYAITLEMLRLHGFEAGESGQVELTDIRKRQAVEPAPVGTVVMVREAETVFSENNAGFRTFKLTAMPGSEFMLDTFRFSASRRDALPSATQPRVEDPIVGGPSAVGGFGGLDWMTLGLIIGGTALCLIGVIVVALAIVRRRRSNSRSSSSSIVDSKLNSAMDMRPALNAVHDSSLASTQELSDMPPPPYATTGSGGQDTGGLYLPLPEQGQQRYLDLQVKPASERGANLYQTSGQALAQAAARLPQVNSYQELQNMTAGASTYGELERKFGAGYDSVPDGLGSPRSVGTATSSLPTISLGSGPIVAPRTMAPPNSPPRTMAPPNLPPPRTMAPPNLPPPRMQAYNNLPGAGVPRAGHSAMPAVLGDAYQRADGVATGDASYLALPLPTTNDFT